MCGGLRFQVVFWSLHLPYSHLVHLAGGDAKIFPALGLFVAYSDWIDFMIVLVAAMIAAVLLVIILRLTPLQKYTPEWKTWNAGRFIPMGLALGSSIIFYYVLALNTL